MDLAGPKGEVVLEYEPKTCFWIGDWGKAYRKQGDL